MCSNYCGIYIAMYYIIMDFMVFFGRREDSVCAVAAFIGFRCWVFRAVFLCVSAAGALGFLWGIPVQEGRCWSRLQIEGSEEKAFLETLLLMNGLGFSVIYYATFFMLWVSGHDLLEAVFLLPIPWYTFCRFWSNCWTLPDASLAKWLFLPWLVVCIFAAVSVTYVHYAYGRTLPPQE
jgi:hypothetical protein